jgi:hypothetical protein
MRERERRGQNASTRIMKQDNVQLDRVSGYARVWPWLGCLSDVVLPVALPIKYCIYK